MMLPYVECRLWLADLVPCRASWVEAAPHRLSCQAVHGRGPVPAVACRAAGRWGWGCSRHRAVEFGDGLHSGMRCPGWQGMQRGSLQRKLVRSPQFRANALLSGQRPSMPCTSRGVSIFHSTSPVTSQVGCLPVCCSADMQCSMSVRYRREDRGTPACWWCAG